MMMCAAPELSRSVLYSHSLLPLLHHNGAARLGFPTAELAQIPRTSHANVAASEPSQVPKRGENTLQLNRVVCSTTLGEPIISVHMSIRLYSTQHGLLWPSSPLHFHNLCPGKSCSSHVEQDDLS